jgi:sporulation protein YlmC with PRC-barrel domain
MLKKHMLACLIATAFAAPAFAQNTTIPSGATDRPAATGTGSATSGSNAMTPGSSPATMAPNASSAASTMPSSSGQFMTQIQPDQILASKLIGTRVISANNESIGDINDVIVDRNGQAVAAVVGVGGFLGIGEKNVAVPYKSLEFASREQVNAMSNADKNAAGKTVTTTGSTNTTGAAGSSTMATNNAPNTVSSDDTTPARVVLRMTKEELRSAPAFNTKLSK